MTSRKITLLLFVLIGIQLSLEEDSNTWMDTTFRISKLNFIWSKAIHHLSDKAMIKRLKDELDKFDSLYLSVKAAGAKSAKLTLEEVDSKLVQMLEKYGLESTVNAYMKKYKWRSEEDMKKENSVLLSEKFRDPKLQKLWHVAQNSHFSEAALKALHKELKDHEQKVEIYDDKVRLFNEFNNNAVVENSFEMKDKLSRELKVHHNNIMDSYDVLQEKVKKMSQKVFSSEKVENLWHLAMQNPNFTASELESIRIELDHFDKRLKKMKYHDEELEAARKEQEKLGKFNVIDGDISSFEEENKRLARKLRKLENYLEMKIVHTEL
uniref:Alpha-2-macroglobulin RAP C-terminal domain-containing protein n=1 Tax=Setaria digitata TaxID=48799 RepID=A0A915PTY5_9BILA